MWLNIASGAFVRITGSGLGCSDWPQCHNGALTPPSGYHAAVEFSNRLVALVGIIVAVLAYLVARRMGDRVASRLAAATAFLGLVQIPLGALTVAVHLHFAAVILHFLVALVATALATALWARRGVSVPPTTSRIRPLAAAATIAVAGLIVSGALVSAASPFRGDPRAKRIDLSLADLAYIHVRVAILAIVVLSVLLVVLARSSGSRVRWRGPAIAVLVLVPLQAAIGEYQYHESYTAQLVLAHVSVAGALWIAMVSLTTRIVQRPTSSLRSHP